MFGTQEYGSSLELEEGILILMRLKLSHGKMALSTSTVIVGDHQIMALQ